MSNEPPKEGIVAAIKTYASEEDLRLITEGMYQDELVRLTKKLLGDGAKKLNISSKIFEESRNNIITPERAYQSIVEELATHGFKKRDVDGYFAQMRGTIDLQVRKDVYEAVSAELPEIKPPNPSGFAKFATKDTGQETRRL